MLRCGFCDAIVAEMFPALELWLNGSRKFENNDFFFESPRKVDVMHCDEIHLLFLDVFFYITDCRDECSVYENIHVLMSILMQL